MNNPRSVSTLQDPSQEEFSRVSQRFDLPVLIAGAVRNWPAFTEWNESSLRNLYACKPFKVASSPDGVFRGDPDVGFERVFEKMSFAQFLDRGSKKEGGRSYYLQQTSLSAEMPELQSDVRSPEFIGKVEMQAVNFWMGFGGNVTPLHFDVSHNVLAQVRGAKRVKLFSPANSRYLYPYPAQSRIPHMSMIDLENPDLDRFPLLAKARSFEVDLAEGDMLFIPFSWWHTVRSLSASISVNFWWKPDFLAR